MGKPLPLGVAGRPEPLGAPSEGAGAEVGQCQGGTLAVLRCLANRLALEFDAFDATQVGRAHLKRIHVLMHHCVYTLHHCVPYTLHVPHAITLALPTYLLACLLTY